MVTGGMIATGYGATTGTGAGIGAGTGAGTGTVTWVLIAFVSSG